MGVADLRDAFNAAATGQATAEQAFMAYRHQHDAEYCVLQFTGRMADGTPFAYETPPMRGDTPLIEAARTAAADLLKQHAKVTP